MTRVCYFIYFLLILTVEQCSGVIYRLNDNEFYKMPPVFHLDSYDLCLKDRGGLYCTADFALASDTPSPLLDMIRQYSEFTPRHYNHSKLTYGLCVSTTCNDIYVNRTADLRVTLEACLNESMWNKYKLKTKVSNEFHCNRHEEELKMDTLDIIVAVIIGIVALLNVVGSIYDFYFTTQVDGKGNKFLLCFAIRRNWYKLISPAAEGPEERLKRLVTINGIKAMTVILVITAHCIVRYGYCVDSTRRMEEYYDSWATQLLLNGTLVVQSFLLVSGFLLIYNLQLHMETHERHWSMLPKLILMRWLRLTPSYAMVMAYIMTWHRFTGAGPFWKKVVLAEVSDCRRNWWQHLLYVNNYIDGYSCLPYTWYLAVDTQLYILGIVVYLACGSNRSRMMVLSPLALAGLIIPAAITYYNDLDGTLMASPEINRVWYISDPTYQHAYVKGHANIAGYVIGMGLGYLIHYSQQHGFDASKYKRYRGIYWAIVPIGVGVVLFGKIFYSEAPRVSIYMRALAAGLLKPIFSCLVAIIIASCVFKYESVYRSVGEWGFWTPLARLTYSVFLVHSVFVKYGVGTQTSLFQVSLYVTAINIAGTICFSFLAACVLHLLVEAPSGRLAKVLTSPGK